MPITTYCTDDDIALQLSEYGLAAATDDEETGDMRMTGSRASRSQRMRERAFNRINAFLTQRYILSELAGNAWLRDCEVVFAIYYLEGRRLNVPGNPITEEYKQYLEELKAIAKGEMRLPNQLASFDDGPCITNYDVQRGRTSPARVSPAETTGKTPVPTIVRRETTKLQGTD